MRNASPYLILVLMLVVCFSLATTIQPRTAGWSERARSGDVLKLMLGDGRRLFANHFFVQADISFHSGYYPSIFDRRETPKESAMTSSREEHGEHSEAEHEKEMAFLGQSRDWIERFGRHFRITEHTHLAHGQEREILPWLKISAELDPQKIDTYTVAAYWLRTMGKEREAEGFLREGLRNNPNSHELLFELGRLYRESLHEDDRARNVWDLALRKWREQESRKEKPDLMGLEQIAVNLGRLEADTGRPVRAIEMLELAKKLSPHPVVLQQQIDEIRQKSASPPAPLKPGE